MVVNDTKVYLKMKNKSSLNIEKRLLNEKKRIIIVIINHKNTLIFSTHKILYSFRKFVFVGQARGFFLEVFAR